ncbi:MAG: polyprenyl synthetase family protein [Hellea sp.]|nr:polyprenyl synthetase family protein [Hellea sp.]
MLKDSIDFKSHLKAVSKEIEAVLRDILPLPSGNQKVVMEASRYAALGGGKRLRPFLMVETARMLGSLNKGVYIAGAALECMHVYSLVHDDLPCMDNDDFRRGKPTVHKKYNEALAVLTGDNLLTISFGILADSKVHEDPNIRMTLISDLAKAGGASGMIGGQIIDISKSSVIRDETFISQLQKLKTGALIEYAVTAGATMSNASESEKTALKNYARDIGLAFQIKDDILDVEGDAEIIGKSVGKDDALGKVTFVSILGLENARIKASQLGKSAVAHLAPFGKKAEILSKTVDFILNRAY